MAISKLAVNLAVDASEAKGFALLHLSVEQQVVYKK